MTLYFAGFRLSDLKARPELPGRVMLTYDDVGPYGDGEQKKIFRLLSEHRRASPPCVSTTPETTPSPKGSRKGLSPPPPA